MEKTEKLKSLFFKIIAKLELDQYDDETVDDLIYERDYTEFTPIWEELSEDQPLLDGKESNIVNLLSNEVYDKIMELDVHHELSSTIHSDFELILTYLIKDVNNHHISYLLHYYCTSGIPTYTLEKEEKTLEELLLEYENWNGYQYTEF
ncbi:hypothetical protein [Elizabethkingia anophelis]|uniref:hypothetical protein n=1 Tax=Elizabethkingia anophelis TaxID=1117645 RepID=UPI000751412B|nr:hypothetical protein [Elizabethkingia anophelis]AQW89705.1 hypothetical protein BBD28_03100 [Elizabethkingia anophelis]KUY16318.1 hypothetical protein ATB94_05705 [Elizabethkingia anophelis]MCT3744641.1 hypothetical protein [Elizabethkingia anophelis]MDC8026482.1 hypothetical protein [Elizabethkingia anophelis]MDV3491320.1 hypothetical protein [Elizabethkingia anophelis]